MVARGVGRGTLTLYQQAIKAILAFTDHPTSNFSSWIRFSQMLQSPLITLSAFSPCHPEQREGSPSLTAMLLSTKHDNKGTTTPMRISPSNTAL